MKRQFTTYIIICTVLILSYANINPAQARYFARHDKHARILYDLGLYEGISSSYFEPDLNSTVNREAGIALLIKLFGENDKALSLSNRETRDILSEYTDRQAVSNWAEKYMAYAIKTDMLKGVTDRTLSPKQTMDGKTYSTIILRKLGYDIPKEKWDIAAYILAYKDGLAPKEAKEFNDKFLIKDDLVAISFRALGAKNSRDEYLVTELIKDGIVSEKTALKLFLVKYSKDKLVPDNILYYYIEPEINRQKMVLDDGTLFEGEVKDGKADGYGTLNYPGQLRYTGEIKNNKKHGKGIFVWPNGDIYEGEFFNDSMTGYGTFVWISGDKYQGRWVNGAFSGNGTFTWKSGDQYSGEWGDGKFNGFGTFKWTVGEIYSGNWKDGEREGQGTFMDAQGNEKSGLWSKGKFVE